MVETWHPDEDLLLEVALGTAVGADREEVSAHLATCGVCRRHYDDLAGGIEQILPAVPRTAPPPDFESAVLSRLAAQRGRAVTPASTDGARDLPRRRRGPWRPVAAGTVLGIAVGAGIMWGIAGRSSEEEPPSEASEWSAELVTGDGTEVGTVSRSYAENGPALVIDVTGGEPGRNYGCVLTLEDGTRTDAGQWELAADRANSWVVDDPGVQSIDLVAASGVVWATADL